jgi:transposase
MQVGRPLFSQVMDFIPWTSFDRLVEKYDCDKNTTRLRCSAQFRAMAFAQMTFRESLRDIEASLNAHPSKLYGMGFRNPVPKSTLADANELRDWRLWQELATFLIRRARKLYAQDDIGLDLDNTAYALDSTTIDLCLSLFPWADFRSTKAAVKMHTLIDLRGPIPSFIHVSDGKMGDALALDLITPEAGAIYVMDRGYVDFRRLHVFTRAGAFFVTRAKVNMKYHRVYTHPVDKSTGVMADQTIALDGFYTKRDYPQHLRRVRYVDPETGKRLVFLTNNFSLPAITIAALYKKRWQVELFFKWIKQNLRIKHFYGTSENAVKTQIWIAVCVYVLAAIIEKELDLEISLYTFLQILSVRPFEKTPVSQAFFTSTYKTNPSADCNSLNLFS